MDSKSNGTGSRFQIVRRTVFRSLFIDMSPPGMVPLMTVLKEDILARGRTGAVELTLEGKISFLSSIVTLSLFSFIKKRTSFIFAT